MAAKRHHASKKHHKEHITAHDRVVDRENLSHARHHASKKHHKPEYSEHAMHHIPHESHGGKMDPEHYREPHRGVEPRGYREGREQIAGTDPRRTFEMQEAGMIHMDPRAIANLPQEVMIKPYPHTGPYMPEGLDDTIAGVDRQMDYDDDKRRDSFYPKKV